MNDDSAQSSHNSYGQGGVNQDQQGPQQAPSQPASAQPPVTSPPSLGTQQPAVPAHGKEQAPIGEHIKVTDPMEKMPELQQELREHGVDIKTDEAQLELTREHQSVGMNHAPSSAPIKSVLEEEKPEFPLTDQQAEVEAKKASVWSSLRWLATFVLRQMKIKRLSEETTK